MPAPIDRPVYNTKKEAVPSSGSLEQAEGPVVRQSGTYNSLMGLIIIALGILLIFWLFARGHSFSVPFVGRFYIPHLFPLGNLSFGPGILFQWTPTFLTLLVIAGLFLIILGGLRFFRFIIGCGMVIFGSLLIFLFIPFMPNMALFPVALVIGSVLILFGGIMFVAGLLKG